MALRKRPTAPSSRSTQYHCPRCNTLVYITVTFDPDEEYGDTIGVAVYCPKCKDQRVESLSESEYPLGNLVDKIGT